MHTLAYEILACQIDCLHTKTAKWAIWAKKLVQLNLKRKAKKKLAPKEFVLLLELL